MLLYLIGILVRKEKGLVETIEPRKEDLYPRKHGKGDTELSSPENNRKYYYPRFKSLVVSSFGLPSSLSKDLHK